MMLVYGVVGSLAVMLLWNALIPAIFGLGTITWLQALGLLALSKILFGGRSGWGRKGRHRGGKHMKWRNKFAQKWSNMSEEDKIKMKEKWGKGCHGRGPWNMDTEQEQEAPQQKTS